VRKLQYIPIGLLVCWLFIEQWGNAIAENKSAAQFDASQWTEIVGDRQSGKGRGLEIVFPYATTDNFVNTKLYPCARCFLRPNVAQALQQAHRRLQQQGYGGLRLFDCYRPRPIQRKMWEIKPDTRYVANPDRGSDHNRGTAIDLTILDRSGEPLDLGTPFDEFSPKAHHTYLDLPPKVLKNRLLLKNTMAAVGFHHIETEWWHYAWSGKKPNLGDWIWNCN
jgi:zinc D-Ala-D-Ala dipeptidase